MRLLPVLLLSLALAALAAPASAASFGAASIHGDQGPEPRVRAILFYSPQCPHCHDVMRDHLPPLLQRHGDALLMVAVNVDTRQGQALYQAVARHFELPRQRLGVPALVVGETVLVGSWEIPSRLPGLVEAGLAGTGVDWPPIAEVRSFLSLQGIAAGPAIQLESWMLAGGAAAEGGQVVRILGAGHASGGTSVSERFMSDPLGNAISVLVLLGMLVVLALSLRAVYRPSRPLPEWPVWAIPALAVAGAAIAAYMGFVEVTGAEAVCGPVGDCNRVQLSPYASLAGIPVGVLGVLGYVALGGLWLAGRGPMAGSPRTRLLLWGAAAVGVVFSIYLTFLEPFVIGATCIWCINSALIMTLILVAATPAAARARRSLTRSAARSTDLHARLAGRAAMRRRG